MKFSRRLKRKLIRSLGYFLRSLYRLVMSPFVWVGWIIASLSRFLFHSIHRYWVTRRLRYLLFGSPALILIVSVSYVVASSLILPVTNTRKQYRTAGRTAVTNEKYEVAKIYLQRAVELGAQDTDTLFDMARTAEQTKDFVRMQAILEKLAPIDHAVHAPSHLWEATKLLTKKNRTSQELKQSITHLGYVLKLNPDNQNAHALLGEIYLQMRLFQDAIPHLAAVAPHRPPLSLSLAKAYQFAGEKTKAIYEAKVAEAYFEKKSIESPYHHDHRLKWADCLMMLERFQQATLVLNDGIKLDDDQRFHFGLARTYIAWSDTFNLKTNKQRQQKLKLLSAGLQANPNEMLLFDRMMPILSLENETAEEAEQFLLDNISNGVALGVCHLLLGSNAVLEKKSKQASFHLEQSIKHMPSAPIIANNLAWYLTLADEPDLERAMSLIEPVVNKFPKGHAYRETRGQILVRQGKWKAAINDLEFALPKYKKNPQTHDGLSVAYENIGNDKLSKQHRSICNQLINTSQ